MATFSLSMDHQFSMIPQTDAWWLKVVVAPMNDDVSLLHTWFLHITCIRITSYCTHHFIHITIYVSHHIIHITSYILKNITSQSSTHQPWQSIHGSTIVQQHGSPRGWPGLGTPWVTVRSPTPIPTGTCIHIYIYTHVCTHTYITYIQ